MGDNPLFESMMVEFIVSYLRYPASMGLSSVTVFHSGQFATMLTSERRYESNGMGN